jgi:hypothetical protein
MVNPYFESVQRSLRKLLALAGVFLLIAFLNPANAQFNFSIAQLQGVPALGGSPTTLQFGPDGKLYVGTEVGRLWILTIVKNGSVYSVTNSQSTDLVLQIPNHDDNGAVNTQNNVRQVTGILVVGTAANPVMYVSSSDNRVGGGGSAGDLNLDTNSGIVSRLTWNGSSWEKVDIIRGLPRSEENHANNGLQLDASTNTLYVTVGGITNAGSPSNNFAFTTEYALSAAIISVDLNVIESLPVRGSGNNKYIYDLPTLDDPTRTNVSNPDYNPNLPGSQATIDQLDPFGGNDGLNQAKLVVDGPVQVYSPGWRNVYDIVLTKAPGKAGRMYTVDNGANAGWGGYPKNFNTPNITNEYVNGEPGSTGSAGAFPMVNNLDNFQLVSKPGMAPIYGGHPNPIRANPAGAGLYTRSGNTGTFSLNPTSDWPPVPLSMADPREADFLMPGVDDGALSTFNASTNGIAEYLSSSFYNGQLVGDLFLADFNGTLWRMKMNADGTAVQTKEAFASGFGQNPLDVTIQSTGQVFDGTIWVADYGNGKFYIFTPDPSSASQCTGNNTSYTLDDDGDGYSNADETDNGTNPCNNLSVPADYDGDFVSDKNDNDDDNDGILDVGDVFHRDANNGTTTPGTILYPFLNGNPGTGLFGLGFTGLMSNGSSDPDNLYSANDPGVVMGGAVGLATFPADQGNVNANTQRNGFQFGYNVNSSSPAFSVQSSLIAPFFNGAAASAINQNHREGIAIGTGDQDNFLAIALTGSNSATAGIRVFGESAGGTSVDVFTPIANILNASNIYLYLDVNPQTGIVTPKYSTDVNPNIVTLTPFQLSGALLSKLQGSGAIAITLLAHSGNASTFSAKYDFMNIVTAAPAISNPIVDQSALINSGSKVVNISNVFTDDGGAANLTYSISGNTNTALITAATFNGTNLTLTIAPNTTGASSIKVKATDGSGLFAEDEFIITVSDNLTPSVLINAGGPALTNGGWSADQYFSGGSTYESTDPVTNTTNSALYQTERWGMTGYAIPVTNGTYTVKLHFAEIFFTASGARVFNVNVENGQGNLTNYDIFSKAGGINKAIIETLTNINVTDGTLNINFSAVTDNAKISAIELIPQTGANTAPAVATPIADQSVVVGTANLVVSLANTFTDNNGIANLTFSVSGNTNVALVTGATINGTNLTLTFAAAQTGTANIKVKATDAQGLFAEDEFKVDVLASTPQAAVAINAGGSSVTFGSQTWAADNSFSGGSSYSTSSAIGNTTSDALYQTERWGMTGYAIPVTNGSYTVKLHFAEIFYTANGQRVFNVNVENGQGVLSNYDIHAKGGANNAVIEQFSNVTVTDGVLNIAFTSVVDNAKISAIEIVSNGSTPPTNTAPVVVNPIADQTVNINSGTLVVSLANVFNDDGGAANLALSVSGNTNTALITGTSINGTNLTLTIATGATGTANIKVKATDGAGLFIEDEFKVDVVNNPVTPGSILINSGGAAVTFSGQTWAADNSFTGGSTYSSAAAIAGTTNDAIYQSERWGMSGYAIPVTNGNYTVKLHFAEIHFTAANARKFNVNVEGGQGTLTNYDIFAKVGGNTATFEQFSSVNVTDGVLNISFTSVVDNAKISAIEIIPNGGTPTNTPPVVSTPIADQSVTANTPSLVVSLANTFTDNNGAANITLSVSGNTNTALVTGASITGTNLTLTFASSLTGSSTIKVKATDAQGLFVEDEFVVTVSAAPVANAIRINAGGGAQTFSGITWAADKNFSGGSTYTNAVAIAGTTSDALYQSERYGAMSYNVPVTNGSYTVKLHFAEIYFTSANQRKFNVNIEGGQGVLTNYDIFVKAGAKTATVEQFNTINVTDGTLNIVFTNVTNNAKVSAIEIIPNAATRVANGLSFQAVPSGDHVDLSWVGTGVADDDMEIERSKDGLNFESLYAVAGSSKAKAVQRNYADNLPYQGISYYRLKTITKDGTSSYSATRSVVMGKSDLSFMMYPNPNTGRMVYMEIPKQNGNETLSVRILNMQGAVIYQNLRADRSTNILLKLNLPSQISAGAYFVEVNQNGKRFVSKLIVQ